MKIRRIIADIKENKIPDPTQVFMPWHAAFGKVWMTEIENVLDSEEFDNSWNDQTKMALVKLWESVTMKVQQMQMAAAQQVASGPGGQPQGGQPNPSQQGREIPKHPMPGGTPGGAKILALHTPAEGARE